MKTILSTSVLGKLNHLFLNSTQKEQCGLLFGVKEDSFLVKDFVKTPNISRTNNSFLIRKSDSDAIIASHPLPFIGIFHSHHDSNKPSKADKTEIARTNCLWIIGNQNDSYSSYCYDQLKSKVIEFKTILL